MKLNKLTGQNQLAATQKMAISLFIFVLALIGVYFLNRLLFFSWNLKQFQGLTFLQIGYGFLQGMRFDLAVVAPVVFLFWLIVNIPYKAIRWVMFSLLSVFNLLLLLVNMIDIELVNFTGRRFTKSHLFMASEGQVSNFTQYVFLTFATLGMLFVTALIFYFIFKNLQKNKGSLNLPARLLLTIALIPLTLLAARGGLQLKPISFVDAKIYNQPYANHLVLNTSFAFIKSFSQNQFKKESYFNRDEMLKYLNQSGMYAASTPYNAEGYNLVVFIVESLSAEYVSPGQTPFINSLKQKGAFFEKSYANGRRSIEGIASILAGIPALMEEPFLNSEFSTNDFIGLGQLFKNKNYHTSFFHGAKNGSMRFDVFTKASGFDHYFGLNEYPDQGHYDGAWGVFDEPFLNYSCNQISKFTEPFASVIFTLSSHQPYKIPDDFKLSPQAKGEPAILSAINYTDWSLERFFECAAQKSWYEKTVFVILADHTGPILDEVNANFASKFSIPIIFYAKDKNILSGLDVNQYAQQIDLLPTLNDLFRLNLKVKNHLARSLYQKGPKTIALYSDQFYQLVGDSELSDQHLKAIKQYFSEGLYDNRLYFPVTEGF